MAPPSADIDTDTSHELPSRQDSGNVEIPTRKFPTPLKYSGSLDNYEYFDVTSVIGREYPKVQLSEILKDDAKIRDLAITGLYATFTPKRFRRLTVRKS